MVLEAFTSDRSNRVVLPNHLGVFDHDPECDAG